MFDWPNTQLDGGFIGLNFTRYFVLIERVDATKPLQFCNQGLIALFEDCIQNGNFYGGLWNTVD